MMVENGRPARRRPGLRRRACQGTPDDFSFVHRTRLARRNALQCGMTKPSAARVRRHRALQRAGLVALTIRVDPVALADFLADRGFLPPGDDDRPALAAALERAIAVWSRG